MPVNKTPHALPILVRFLPEVVKRRIANRPNLIKILDNIGWLFFDKVLRMGVGLFVGVWVARYLGPEQFGIFNYINAVALLFSAVATFGMDSIIVRDLARDQQAQDAILGSAVVIQLAGGFFAWMLSSCVGYLMNQKDFNLIILISFLSTTSIFKISDVIKFFLQTNLCSKYHVFVENCVFLAAAVVKCVLIFFHAKLSIFIFAVWVEGLVTAIGLFFVYVRYGGRFRCWKFQKARWRKMIRDGAPLMISGLAMAGYMRIDQVMLGKMLDKEAVGVFSVALRISEAWNFIPLAILPSLFPKVVASSCGDKFKYFRMLELTHVLMVFVALLFAIPISFKADLVIKFLYGVQYVDAANVLKIHVWSLLFVFLGLASHHWFIVQDLQHYILMRTLCGTVINIVMNLILIPVYGAVGAAISSLIAHALVNFLLNIFSSESRQIFWLQLSSILMVPLWSGRIFRQLECSR